MKEEVVELNVKDICDFPKHPFKINNDLNYEELKNSIIESGVLVPTIVRKICEEQGIKKIPCIVKDISDEEAIILMVDSNLQRDKILPSEKAMAYKMKYDAMKSMTPSVSNKRKDEILGEQVGESREQIRRYIRLNNLMPEL